MITARAARLALLSVFLVALTLLVLSPAVLAQDAGADAPAAPSESEAGDTRPTDVPGVSIGDDLTPAPLDTETEAQIDGWEATIDRIESELDRPELSIDTLDGLTAQLDAVRDEMQSFLAARTAHYDEQVALLEGLAPGEATQVETPQVRALRQSIIDLDAQRQPVALLQGRAEQLRTAIANRRAEEFATRIFAHSNSLLDPVLWIDGTGAIPTLVDRLVRTAESSFSAVRNRATPQAFIGLAVLLLLLVLLAIPLRDLALRKAVRAHGEAPTILAKALAALRIILINAGVPALGFALILFALDSIGGLSVRAVSVLESTALVTILYFFLSGVIRAFLAPGRPDWRLVPVRDSNARQATAFLRLGVAAYAIAELSRTSARLFLAPLPTVQLLEAVPLAVTVIAVLAACRSLLRGLERESGSDDQAAVTHLLWRWTVPVAGLAALAALAAQLFGYLALAAFIIDSLVWTAAVLAALHLATLLVEHVSNAIFQENAKASAWMQDNIGLSRNGLGQFGVLLSGVAKLLLIIAAASFIIAPFGVETGQITDVVRQVFTGIEIGGFSFSLTSILVALALLFAGIVLTRAVQGWLENRYLPRTSLDNGLKASIRTAIGYVGVIAAAMIGLSALGLNLENVALVAGALSVGIGFGLQSIVSNFVSGLILLAERPFKQGDWIVVGEEQGIVKRINVRATELQTFDRATVLIPNQDFIAGSVKNRVHRDTLGRIDVPVGVGYDSDPEKVKEILLEVANAHPTTLSYPEPAVFFIEFGASSLDFMLFAFLADVGNGYGVRSDIRFEIFRRFKEEGIEIPFAQSDVTIRNLDHALAALAKAGMAPPEGLGAGALAGDEGVRQPGVHTVPMPDPLPQPADGQPGSQKTVPDRTVPTDPDDASSDDGGPRS